MGTILKALIAAAAVVLEEILDEDQAAPFISCICNYLMQLKKQKKTKQKTKNGWCTFPSKKLMMDD